MTNKIFNLFLFFYSLILFIFNYKFNGPAYLSDEIGYLTKAATFAGFDSKFSTSWHSAYSLLISQAFYLFDSTFLIWKFITIINIILLSFSIYLIREIKFLLYSNDITLSELVYISFFPSWFVLSGYAFTSIFFILVFNSFLYCYIKYRIEFLNTDVKINKFFLYFSSILLFLLYEIHILGIIIIFTFLFILLINKTIALDNLFVQTILIVMFILTYDILIDNQLNIKMSGEIYTSHYYENLINIKNSLTNNNSFFKFIRIISGQFSFLIIISYGLIFAIFKNTNYNNLRKEKIIINEVKQILCFSLIGLILSGGFLFTSISENTNDHFFHLRYLELILMPIIIIGLSESKIIRYSFINKILIFFFLLLGFVVNININTAEYFNLINMTAFWPIFLYNNGNLYIWFIASFLVIIFFISNIFHDLIKLFLFIILSSFCYFGGYKHHRGILDFYSQPTNLAEYILKNVNPYSCIGFDKSYPAKTGWSERYNLYLFYLYKYKLSYMNLNEWRKNCNGPFISYNPNIEDEEIIKIGYEMKSEIFLYVKKPAPYNFKIKNDNFIFLNRDNSTSNGIQLE